jgi:hypothetical protein
VNSLNFSEERISNVYFNFPPSAVGTKPYQDLKGIVNVKKRGRQSDINFTTYPISDDKVAAALFLGKIKSDLEDDARKFDNIFSCYIVFNSIQFNSRNTLSKTMIAPARYTEYVLHVHTTAKNRVPYLAKNGVLY